MLSLSFCPGVRRSAVVRVAQSAAVTAVILGVIVSEPSAQAQTVPSVSAAAPLLPIGQDGAAALVGMIRSAVGSLERDGMRGTWKGGEPSAVPSEDHYDVSLPTLVITGSDGVEIEIAGAKLSARPKDDGLIALGGTPPGSMMISRNKKPDSVVTLDWSRFAADWGPAYDAIVSADIALSSARIIGVGDKSAVTAGPLSFEQTSTRTGGDRFDGRGRISLSALSVRDAAGKEALAIAGVDLTSRFRALDLALIRTLGLASQSLPAKSAAAPSLSGLLGALEGSVVLTGLHVESPEDDLKGDIGRLSWTIGIDDFDKELGAARLAFELQDLNGFVKPPAKGGKAPPYAQLVPSRLAASITAQRLPTDLFARLDKPAPHGQSEDERILAALQATATEFRLDSASVTIPVATSDAEGVIRFDPAAALGAQGGLTVTLRGLDAIVNLLKPKNGKPDPETREIMGALAMLQAMGQAAGKDDKGRDIRTFRFEVKPDGAMLLNGADISALIGGGEEDAEEEDAPPPPSTKTGRKPKN